MSRVDFHDFQLSLVGYSNSGKTTLLEKLLKKFSEQHFRVGVIKHDAHHLDLDREGKDSYRFWHAGAHAILAHNQNEQFFRFDASHPINSSTMETCDFVFIEGHKQSHYPKIVLLDEELAIWKDLEDNAKQQAVALVGVQSTCPIESQLPYFQRDDLESIAAFTLGFFKQQQNKIPLKGLILCGGHSTRMGQDKSQLCYHGEQQYRRAFSLLTELGLDTYLSCRPDQTFDLPSLHDQLIDFGPLSGLLSAMHQVTNTAFLTIAIDQPNLSQQTLTNLLRHRNPFRCASVAYNSVQDLIEPLCCIYEPRFKSIGFKAIGQGNLSPKKTLEQNMIEKISIDDVSELQNINTPLDYSTIISTHET